MSTPKLHNGGYLMEITDNRMKNMQSIKTVTTVLLLLVGLASIFPLTAVAEQRPYL